jgi:spore germination protein
LGNDFHKVTTMKKIKIFRSLRDIPYKEDRQIQSLKLTSDCYTNLTLIRPRLSEEPKHRIFITVTGKKIFVVYLDENDPALTKLWDRLKLIVQKPVSGIHYLMRELKDNRNSLFPQGQLMENQEQAAAALAQGKFLIMLEDEPRLLVMPVNLFSLFRSNQSSESHWLFFFGLPLMGILAIAAAIFLPALFVAVVAYDYYLIPTNFINPLADSLARAPFSPAMMALLSGITLDMLFEASAHCKSIAKMAVPISAAIVIVLGAVTTGMISGGLATVYGISAIAALAIPDPELTRATRVLKYAAIVLGAIFGVLGVVVTAALTVAHIVALQSLGQSYLSVKSLLTEERLLNPFSLNGRTKDRGKNHE